MRLTALLVAAISSGDALQLSIGRADALKLAAASASAFLPACARAGVGADSTAISPYEVVPGQLARSDKLDVNNSPVSDYMNFPGMYPTIAGKIANGGPYASIADALKNLSESERAVAKKYSSSLIATPNTSPLMDPMRGRDPYRQKKSKE